MGNCAAPPDGAKSQIRLRRVGFGQALGMPGDRQILVGRNDPGRDLAAGAVILAAPAAFAASSGSITSQAACSHTRRRISPSCSLMPAELAAGDPDSRPIRSTNKATASASRGSRLAGSVRISSKECRGADVSYLLWITIPVLIVL